MNFHQASLLVQMLYRSILPFPPVLFLKSQLQPKPKDRKCFSKIFIFKKKPPWNANSPKQKAKQSPRFKQPFRPKPHRCRRSRRRRWLVASRPAAGEGRCGEIDQAGRTFDFHADHFGTESAVCVRRDAQRARGGGGKVGIEGN